MWVIYIFFQMLVKKSISIIYKCGVNIGEYSFFYNLTISIAYLIPDFVTQKTRIL